MGIFRKVGDWLTEKSDHFIRGEAEMPNGYYGSREAEQAYSNVGMEPQGEAERENAEIDEETTRKPEAFGRGNDEYGGRVPYRSKFERERSTQPYQAQPMQQTNAPMQGMNVQPQRAVPQMQAQAQMQAQPQVPQQMNRQQPLNMPPQGAQLNPYPQGYVPQEMRNVVPFPGTQRAPDGSVYAHVEFIVLLRSRNECKDVISYIKLNASVFLNMEFIASDNERQRCVDMLSGAAYTLGCALNKISPRGIYLISSPSVRVVLDPAMQRFTAAPESQGFVRQRYENDGYQGGFGGAYAQPPEPVQETQRSRPLMGVSSGSPTTRFQAQRTQPASFGSVIAGGATGSYQAVNMAVGGATGRYSAGQQ
ncbi:MAG: cell division protein SepF [Clostridia bacterium]